MRGWMGYHARQRNAPRGYAHKTKSPTETLTRFATVELFRTNNHGQYSTTSQTPPPHKIANPGGRP